MSTTDVKQGHVKGSVKNMEAKGKRAAKEAACSLTMELLTRPGYGIKGLIYITMALLAVQGALGKRKRQPINWEPFVSLAGCLLHMSYCGLY